MYGATLIRGRKVSGIPYKMMVGLEGSILVYNMHGTYFGSADPQTAGTWTAWVQGQAGHAGTYRSAMEAADAIVKVVAKRREESLS